MERTFSGRPAFLEVLEIQLLDELRQRQLPGLLIGVGHAAELLRIQTQLPGHLDVSIGKMEAPARFHPPLELFRYLFLHRSVNIAEDSVSRNTNRP